MPAESGNGNSPGASSASSMPSGPALVGRPRGRLKILCAKATGMAPKAVVVGARMHKLAILIDGVLRLGKPFG